MLLNSKIFNQISFFLSNKTLVSSLDEGAKKFGGATKIENTIYSNIEGDNNIKVNDNKNTISLFVPSTVSADSEINNSEYVEKYYNYIKNHFNNGKIVIRNTKGAWYSDDMQKTIIEDITIIEVITNELTQSDINYMLNLGLSVKEDMSQEAVSVTVNNSLCLV
jgi:hypothetical protein